MMIQGNRNDCSRGEGNPMTIKFTDPAVNYYVDDVERAVRFYTEHFGFVETFRTPQQGKPDHVEVRLGGLTLGVASKSANLSLSASLYPIP
jgi:uncharacterized glyoxalase superfamily protein PhnB